MMSDEMLYRRYLDGHDAGLTELMERHGNKLTLYINAYVHDFNDAEDLMIDAFAYLLTKKPSIGDGCLKAYLYKSARHLALRFMAKRRQRQCFDLDRAGEGAGDSLLIEEIAQAGERSRTLRLCMELLHADYREALYLLYFEGLSYAQAALVMGKSEKQLTNLAYRGKQALRPLLEREGITDAYA